VISDSRVWFSGRGYLEVVNERLHTFFHRSTGWRNEFVVVHLDDACRHFVQTLETRMVETKMIIIRPNTTNLVDDAQGLAEFLNSAKVPVVTIAILSNRDIEFNL